MEMSKKAIIFLFNNVEETEFVITANVLRRAGFHVQVVGVEQNLEPTKGVQNIVISPDTVISKCENEMFDVLVIPGGPGVENLYKEHNFYNKVPVVGKMIKEHFDAKKMVAAICGGTKVLKHYGIGKGKKVTTFPKYREELGHGYQVEDVSVVVDENLITSQGPATAFDFAFAIISHALGYDKMKIVAHSIGFSTK